MTTTTNTATYAENYVPYGTVKPGKLAVFIGRCPCKGCNTVKTVHIATSLRATSKNANWVPGVNNVPHYINTWAKTYLGSTPEIYCAKHKRMIWFKEVDGKVSPDHVCDPRCTGAKGHSCECSCGGTNHGKDWM